MRLPARLAMLALAAAAVPISARGATTAPATRPAESPPDLPGRGLAQRPFLYAGEWDTRKATQSIFIVRDGKITWQYTMPLKRPGGGVQEFDDATRLSNGNVVFSRMSGAGEVAPDGHLVWNYDAPPGTEVHSCQPLDLDRVLIMRNGNPAQLMVIDTRTNAVEKVIPVPVGGRSTHGQFRHVRMTAAGTFLVAHMDLGKVSEYDATGREIWSCPAPSCWAAVRLKNGNTLLSGNGSNYVREVNPAGQVVWELTQKDIPDYHLFNVQECDRLANGDTLFCNWVAGDKNRADWPGSVQVLEVTPAKRVVWALRQWTPPADLGPATSIQALDEPGIPERPGDLQH